MTKDEQILRAACLALEAHMFPGGQGPSISHAELGVVLEAARSLLPPEPTTKRVEVWYVEHTVQTGPVGAAVYMPQVATFSTEAKAREAAVRWAHDQARQVIRVTGPHEHVVPA